MTATAATQVLLVRHGQSEWNALGRWQGRADPPLSDLGRRQARAAAQAIGTPEAIVASPLLRAHETAEIIAEEIGVGPVALDDDLVERDAGEWSGLTRADIDRDWPGYLEAGRRPPGYEDDEPMIERLLAAFERIRAVAGGTEVLVLAHGGVVYTLESAFGAGERGRLDNLGGVRLTLGPGDPIVGERVELLDETNLHTSGDRRQL